MSNQRNNLGALVDMQCQHTYTNVCEGFCKSLSMPQWNFKTSTFKVSVPAEDSSNIFKAHSEPQRGKQAAAETGRWIQIGSFI